MVKGKVRVKSAQQYYMKGQNCKVRITIAIVICTIILATFPLSTKAMNRRFGNENYHVAEVNGTFIEKVAERHGPQKPWYTWNLVDDGDYSFNGLATISPLYTNYYLEGKTSYSIHVVNDSKSWPLEVRVVKKKSDTVIKTYTVDPKTEANFSVNNLATDEKIYLYFVAPCDFHGKVQ